MASVSTEKKTNKDEKPRPWYEQPGVKIRSTREAVLEANNSSCIDHLVSMLCHQDEDGCDHGTTIDELQEILWYAREEVMRRPAPNAVTPKRRREVRQQLYHLSSNLFKFLKIADRQGLIEQVV
jgi:hypothetical protein